MYCSNCSCPSCVALRVSSGGYNAVKEDVVRLIAKAGEQGMTLAELKSYSRPLRTIDEERKALMLDQMVASGVLVVQNFQPKAGRGRSRNAYVLAKVSQ